MENFGKNNKLDCLTNYLFSLNAIRVAPAREPFWYTSGLFGPLYINTQFLVGGEKTANRLLDYINAHKDDKRKFPADFLKKLIKQYNTSKSYQLGCELITENIKDKMAYSKIDLISGGERRDWFFSLLVAYKLKTKTLILYKDKSFILFDPVSLKVSFSKKPLRKKVIHVADLTTFGSSYVRYWIPAIKKSGCQMVRAFNVIDRQSENQELVYRKKTEKLTSNSLIKTDIPFFKKAMKNKFISKDQFEAIKAFLNDSNKFIKNFIRKNPRFLKQALTSSDEKTKQRAKLFMNQHAGQYLD